ncbi:MAG TPA: NTP transferase domain-containing protein [Bacteroidota bacterium]|nr:NTP transferase domain-containing protein [Bacteroidota bacterium]
MILGVILAANESADGGWEPAARNMVDVLRSARVTDIVLVAGRAENALTQIPWFAGTILPFSGLAEPLQAVRSVVAGSLPASHHGILICPSPLPDLSQSVVVDLLQGFWTSKKNLIIPVYSGRRGYPILIGQHLYSCLARVSALETLAASAPHEVLEVHLEENISHAGVPATPGRMNKRS